MSKFPDFSELGYQIIRVIGRNREGGRITYLASDLNQDRQIVIKQFQFFKSDPSWSDHDALEREIQVLRRLNHPGIPRYLDSFETPDGLCLVQEYKNAPSLSVPRSFAPVQIKQVAVSILEIIAYLQNQIPLVIHRDIKPENILVDYKNTAYLIDFGFSRIGGEEVAGSSVVKGTPGFMPPEQLWGRITRASDLYGLGMTMICLLGGIKSVDIRNYIGDDYRINFKPLVPKLSVRFIKWLETMVQPNPNERYPNAATALEALKTIDVSPDEFELSQSRSESTATNLSQRLIQFFTLKQSLISIVLGLVVGLSWGRTNHAPWAGLCLSIILSLGLSLVLAIPRSSAKFFSIPPWHAFVGAILVGISVGAVVNPGVVVYYSQYIGIDLWNHQHHKIERGPGFTLYTDAPREPEDTRLVAFLGQFREEIANHLFDPGSASCSADVHMMRDDKNYFGVANRFGIKTPYGFFIRRAWRGPIIVVREGSGLGTLTHQMMYHYLVCAFPEGLSSWATQGVATFVEKFLAIESNGRIAFTWGYRSNWRDPEVRNILDAVNLASFLRKGTEQSVFNSLFLFLHHQKQLIPLLNRLHGEQGDGLDRLEEVFQQPIAEVEQRWRTWLATDALSLPMVEASFMVWGNEARRVETYLQRFWDWDASRLLWVDPLKSPEATIPNLESILAIRPRSSRG